MIVQVSKDIICSGQVMNLLNTELYDGWSLL